MRCFWIETEIILVHILSDKDTLEEAQQNKKQHIAKKLLLKPNMKVLDIGCGWGGMS